jgi:hypothetical protein
MPKAAVNQNRQPPSPENNVWPPGQVRRVGRVRVPERPNHSADENLRASVLSTDIRHASTALLWR